MWTIQKYMENAVHVRVLKNEINYKNAGLPNVYH